VISPGSPSIGEGRTPGQQPEEGRVAPTMPRTERTDFYLFNAAMPHHGAIPAKYTCDGEGVAPALAWKNPPEKVKSYTILVDDPDHQGGDFVHWIVVNIPASIKEIPEGLPMDGVSKALGGAKQGKNGEGKVGWTALCPEKGPAHRVVFRIYALDDMLDVPANPTRAEVETAYKGHFLGQSAIIAAYQRK